MTDESPQAWYVDRPIYKQQLDWMYNRLEENIDNDELFLLLISELVKYVNNANYPVKYTFDVVAFPDQAWTERKHDSYKFKHQCKT